MGPFPDSSHSPGNTGLAATGTGRPSSCRSHPSTTRSLAAHRHAVPLNPQPFASMGFDKDDTQPVVNTSKRTTKVNISMAIGILVFFAVAGLVLRALYIRPAAAGADGVALP